MKQMFWIHIELPEVFYFFLILDKTQLFPAAGQLNLLRTLLWGRCLLLKRAGREDLAANLLELGPDDGRRLQEEPWGRDLYEVLFLSSRVV